MSRRDCARCVSGLVPCVCDDMPNRYEIRETQPGDFVPMPQRGFVLESEDDKGEAYPDSKTWAILVALNLIAAPAWYWAGSNLWELIK